MACLCTDRLDDLKVKFDLILELAQTVLSMLPTAVVTQITGGGGGGGAIYGRLSDWPERQYEQLQLLDSEIMEFIQIIVSSGILD